MDIHYPTSDIDLTSFKAIVRRDAPHYLWVFDEGFTVAYIGIPARPVSPFHNTCIGIKPTSGGIVEFDYHRLSMEEKLGNDTHIELTGNLATEAAIIAEFCRIKGVHLNESDVRPSESSYTLSTSPATLRIKALEGSLVWRGSCSLTYSLIENGYMSTEDDNDVLVTEEGDTITFEG